MPRTAPPLPPIPALSAALLKPHQHIRLGPFECHLLTPLFGGGANPRECAEPDALIHPLQIRGLLRKWWRATIGAQKCATVAQLQELEGHLWGTATHGGRIRVHADTLESPAPRPLSASERAVFPQSHGERLFPILHGDFDKVRQQVSFRISIDTEPGKTPCDKDAFFALIALVRFGGVGSRWRRGTAAINPKSAFPTIPQTWTALAAPPGVRRPWPHLSQDFPPLFKPCPGTALDAMVALIDDLRAYRHSNRCSDEFISKRGAARFPSALILRPVQSANGISQMAATTAMSSPRTDGNGRSYDDAIKDAIDFFRTRGYK